MAYTMVGYRLRSANGEPRNSLQWATAESNLSVIIELPAIMSAEDPCQ